jgi:DNA-binding XRE family transcriptional regulator
VQLALLASAAEVGVTEDELDQAQAELARAEAGLAAASRQLAAALGDAARQSRRLAREAQAARSGEAAGSGDPPDAAAPPADECDDQVTAGLLELRADPLGADVRILLAIEPADTVTLLAVLDGSAAVNAHRHQAIKLAGELLAELRANGWPRADAGSGEPSGAELTFAYPGAFLATYFPHCEAEVRRRSAQLAASRTLASLRRQHGASLDELAKRTGLSATALRRLEDDDLGPAELADVAAYIRALGGRLDLTADFGAGQQVPLS